MKILLVPDIHLGKGTSIGKDPIGVGLNSRIEDQKKLLNFVTEYVSKNKIEHIFVMGDVWDSVLPKPAVVKVFCEWIKDVTEFSKLHIIVGNHDFVRSGLERVSMLDSLDTLKIQKCSIYSDRTSILLDNVNVVFMPFTDRKQMFANSHDAAIKTLRESLVSKRKDNVKNIVLGHMCLEGSIWVGDEVSQESNELFCPLNMFDGFDHVWMGHVHKFQILKNDNQIIGHVGSLDKTAFTGPDSFNKMLVELSWDSGGSNIKFKSIELPTRPLVSIDIDIPSSCKDLNTYVINHIKNINVEDAIVRVEIKLNTYDAVIDQSKILNILNKNNVFHVCSFKEKKPTKKIIAKNTEVDETISPEKAIKHFINNLDANDAFKNDLFDFCANIIKEIQE